MKREEAINWLKAISFVSDPHITEAIDMAIEALSADVVRCKDCKHYSVEGDVTRFGYCNGVHEHDTDPNGFCHHGERKEQ